MGNLLDLVEDLLISLLGLAALLGVSAAERLGEQLSESITQVDLCAQPKPCANGIAMQLPSFT